MRIKSPRTTNYIETHTLNFDYIGSNGSGCSFDCDKEGNVDVSALNPCALLTYKEALSGEVTRRENVQYTSGVDEDGYTTYVPITGTGEMVTRKVSKGEIVTYGKYVHTPAVGECNRCGRDVHLSGFTNTCECGTDYNMSGQMLAHRSQWGEETGETVDDILRADTDAYMDEECPPTVRSERSPIITQSREIHVDVV